MKVKEMKDAILNLSEKDRIYVIGHLIDNFVDIEGKLDLFNSAINKIFTYDKNSIEKVHNEIFAELKRLYGPHSYGGVIFKRQKDLHEIGDKILALKLSDSEFNLVQQIQVALSHTAYIGSAHAVIKHYKTLEKLGDNHEEIGVWYNLFDTQYESEFKERSSKFMSEIIIQFAEYYNYKNPVKNET